MSAAAGSRFGKRATVEETIAANVLFVHWVIKRHFRGKLSPRYGLTVDDMLSMGFLGIARAFESFDERRAKWGTHAYWHVRGAITAGLHSYSAYTTSDKQHLDGRWSHAQLDSPGEVASPVNASTSDSDAPEEVAARNEDAELAVLILGQVGGRDAAVLRKRFLEGKTLAQSGRELGVSVERVRQIELRALASAKRIPAKRLAALAEKPWAPCARRATTAEDNAA
jgi:RNA polymerase sigma factor (sigma-70 family)